MKFPAALSTVLSGGVVTRTSWQGSGLTVGVVTPEPIGKESNAMTPFLALRAQNGRLMPWVPGQADMFADDWAEVEGVAGHG